MPPKHAVHQLFEQRLSRSTKAFKARGGSVIRCPKCRIDQQYCICALCPKAESQAGFVLLYYDDEVLKPSNTGKLIADIFVDTFAFIWQRTEVEQALLDLLADDSWYPIVVFPQAYVEPNRPTFIDHPVWSSDRRPLFILLDGSWREAKKMFRKSPYLDRFPVLSMTPERVSQYLVRKATQDHQLATAEVAAMVLSAMQESYNGKLLSTWFDFFSYRYQQGVKRENVGDPTSQERLTELVQKGQIR